MLSRKLFSNYFRLKLQGLDKFATVKQVRSSLAVIPNVTIEIVRKSTNKNFAEVVLFSPKETPNLKLELDNMLKLKTKNLKLRKIEDPDELQYFLGRRNVLSNWEDESVRTFIRRIANRRKVKRIIEDADDLSVGEINYKQFYFDLNYSIEIDKYGCLKLCPERTVEVPQELKEVTEKASKLIVRLVQQFKMTIFSTKDNINGTVKSYNVKHYKGKSCLTFVLSDLYLDEIDKRYLRQLIAEEFNELAVVYLGFNNKTSTNLEDVSRVELVTTNSVRFQIDGVDVDPVKFDKFDFFESDEYRALIGDKIVELIDLERKIKSKKETEYLVVFSMKPTNLFDYIVAAEELRIERNFAFRKMNELHFGALVRRVKEDILNN